MLETHFLGLSSLLALPCTPTPCDTDREVVVRLVVGRGMALFTCASCRIRILEKNCHYDEV